MSEITIRPLTSDEHARWDALVADAPGGTLFASTPWLQASGRAFAIWGAFRGDELKAGLPVCTRPLAFGRAAAMPPRLTPHMGVVFAPEEAKYVKTLSWRKDVGQALARALKSAFATVRLSFPPGEVDIQPFIWEGFESRVRYTYVLTLDDLDRVWGEMDETRRRNIRRAEKDGLVVDFDADFDTFFALVEKTYARQREAVRFGDTARRYHAAMTARSRCRSFVTRDGNGVPLAGVFVVWDDRQAYYLLGGYDPERGHHGATALAMWEAIRFCNETLGLAAFDFEGSMIPAIERFFRKFGGCLTPCYTVDWAVSWIKPLLWIRKRLRQ